MGKTSCTLNRAKTQYSGHLYSHFLCVLICLHQPDPKNYHGEEKSTDSMHTLETLEYPSLHKLRSFTTWLFSQFVQENPEIGIALGISWHQRDHISWFLEYNSNIKVFDDWVYGFTLRQWKLGILFIRVGPDSLCSLIILLMQPGFTSGC